MGKVERITTEEYKELLDEANELFEQGKTHWKKTEECCYPIASGLWVDEVAREGFRRTWEATEKAFPYMSL